MQVSSVQTHLSSAFEDDLDALSVTELRRRVRERGIATGSQVVYARRDALIAWLRGAPADASASTPAIRELRCDMDSADRSISSMLASMARDAVDSEITARRDDLRPTITINLGERASIDVPETAHPALPDCIALAHAGLPMMLVGPSGSGKTTLAAQVAAALGRRFTFNSMSAGVSESHLLGRVLPDASGNWSYQPSPFVQTFQGGGVHLFDEIDAADPNLLVILNAALANGALSVPFAQAEPMERHAEFVCIAAANTFGRGGDRQYVGRSALDAATLDRFSVSTVFIDYDKALERRLAESACGEHASTLLAWAWAVRDAIDRNRLRRILSTRTIVNAAKLLAIGRPMDSVRASYFSGWSADERAKVGAE
jgi:cobaltochelatase CobS